MNIRPHKNRLPTAALTLFSLGVTGLSFGAALPINPANTVTATMDGGISKSANTWYEFGINPDAPATGIVTGFVPSQTDTNSTYFFQPATSLNALMLDNATPAGTIRFAEPMALYGLSLAGASGNGAGMLDLTLQFLDGTETNVGPVTVGDWFNNTNVIQTVNGRIDVGANSFNSVGTSANNPRVLAINTNLPLTGTTNAIAAIRFNWAGGATTHTMIFAVSGDTNGLGHYVPLPLMSSSYNQDIIVGLAEVSQNAYRQENLVSDITNINAVITDTNLVNPRGIAASPSGPFWLANTGAGLSGVYNSTGGVQSLVVNIPGSNGTNEQPTGVVFSGNTNDFLIPLDSSNAPALFLFATEGGTIAAWAGGTNAYQAFASPDQAMYTGLAVGSGPDTNGTTNFLYVADFRNARIDVFDSSFRGITNGFPLTTNGVAFVDTNLPAGFAPFNVQNLGGRIYVTYAKQDTNTFSDVPGPGNGYVDVFDTSGALLKRLVDSTNGPLNSPWGLALAPASFGPFSGQLLVGNAGDGRIHVFDATLGNYLGQLLGTNETPITIPGLWALRAGNGGEGGDSNRVYFTAGIVSNTLPVHGLFGSLSFPLGQSVAEPWELSQTVNGYQDNFEGATRNTNWVAVGPGGDQYLQTNNVLQVSTSVGDPNHLLYIGTGASNEVQEILARIRVLAFAPGGTNDAPRGGVAVGVNTNILINSSYTNWSGYNLEIRDNAQDNVAGRQFKFLDDLRAWGPAGLSTNIPGQTTTGWTENVWYWLRLRMDPLADGTNSVFGKVWVADGITPEPANWTMTWAPSPTPLHSGFAGITGSSSGGLSQFEVDYVLIKSADLPTNTVNFTVRGAGPTPPVIYGISRSTNQIAVNWFGGILQQSTNLFSGIWSEVLTNSPWTNSIGTEPANFFRVGQSIAPEGPGPGLPFSPYGGSSNQFNAGNGPVSPPGSTRTQSGP